MNSKSDYHKTHLVRHFIFITLAVFMVIYAAFVLFWKVHHTGSPSHIMVGIIFGLLFLGLGLLAYLKKPSDPGARIFYLLMVCICSQNIVFMNFQGIQNPFGVLSDILIFFIAPLTLHFTLIFPEEKKITTQYRVLLRAIYIPVFFFISAYVFLWFKGGHIYLDNQNNTLFYGYIILIFKSYFFLCCVYLGSAFFSLAHTYFTTTSSEAKKQVQWIFYGIVVGFFVMIPGINEFFKDSGILTAHIWSLPHALILGQMILLSVCILAIFKYRLMDIETVIHQSMAYFLVIGIAAFLYFLGVTFFSWTFGFSVTERSLTIYMVFALGIAFLFRPMHVYINQWIDRFFLREKYELTKAMEPLMQAIISVRNPQVIFQKVYNKVAISINIKDGGFWYMDKKEKALKQIAAFPDSGDVPQSTLSLLHPLTQVFMKNRKGLTHYQVKTERRFHSKRQEYLAHFQETGMEISLPLICENTLIGVMGFGKKRSGDLYSRKDVSILTDLAHQTAVALENARAYNQTERLNNELKDKVHQIEQQQEEILALQKRLLNENIYLREEIQQNFNFEEIIGDSQPMRDVLAMVEKIAPTLSTVLLRGESGTGKELIARAIHFNSLCKEGPFVKVNCAAIPANLLESELFGHEKGAFTGAIKQKTGKFELAREGSIFLDEIGDLEPDLQVKLLRVLQEKEFERVGGNKTINADVRIIAATNRDIEKAIAADTFREDLFYRLNVISITSPPLRDRKEDIRELTIHFLRKYSHQLGKSIQNIDSETMKLLKSHDWPGNVRELANVMERAVVLGEGELISINDLPQNIIPANPGSLPFQKGNLPHEVEQLERNRITEALAFTKGNKSEAAKVIGLKRSTFNSKLKKYNI